ncbi:MAG: asparagine synthase-related protein, partial [Phycisphaerae bacterium]
PDVDALGGSYIGAAADAIAKWLKRIPDQAPVGVCFSGGIDSGAIFLLTVHVMQQNSLDLGRLKAFTLSVAGGGDDLDQARRFLEANDLTLFHEPIEVPEAWVDYRQTVRILEDYKPLDVQAGSVALALCRGIRERYPDWRFLIDGDGGDENLKDYPIEENPELTIRSVLSNRMLYQEGWGVDSIKHSLVYTGGQSRGCTRSFAPMTALGFSGFSPFTLPDVIEVAEGIPFVELTDWRHDRLYQLKGRIVSRGVEAITGLTMPIFEKRRFQEGALGDRHFAGAFPRSHRAYRNAFQALYDG